MKKMLLLPLFVIFIYGQGQFSGVTYFDYTYDFNEEHDAFGLKRVYFTYQQELSETVSYKFQTDVAQLKFIDDVSIDEDIVSTTTDKTQFVAYLKNAKIDWDLGDGWTFGEAKLIIGLQGMNVFNVTEKTWGFRFLEKSPMDKHKFSSSADMGVACSGKLNNLNYSIMYTNGSGYKSSENDEHKKISTQLVYGEKNLGKKDGINLGTSFSIEPYNSDETTNNKKTLMSFYGGYAGNGLRVGAEFDIYTDRGTDITQQIIAAYGSYKISDTLEFLTYIDLYDPNTKSEDIEGTEADESKDNENNIIAGLNYYPAKGLTITPNMKFNFYDLTHEHEFEDTAQFSVNFQFKF